MQYPFSFTSASLAEIESTLSPARLAKYLSEAKGDRQLAFRLCIWNARLCESFYLPIQLAEVAVRNAMHKPVKRRFSAAWYEAVPFHAILPPRIRDELQRVVASEKKARRHAFSEDHVVAGLSLGFWLNLLTASYERQLWASGFQASFPRLPRSAGRQDIYDRLDRFRRFRNRVAHHYAKFDRSPRAEFQNVLLITDWISAETHWLANELSTVVRVLSRKPSLRKS